jgi:hypothetical protein
MARQLYSLPLVLCCLAGITGCDRNGDKGEVDRAPLGLDAEEKCTSAVDLTVVLRACWERRRESPEEFDKKRDALHAVLRTAAGVRAAKWTRYVAMVLLWSYCPEEVPILERCSTFMLP